SPRRACLIVSILALLACDSSSAYRPVRVVLVDSPRGAPEPGGHRAAHQRAPPRLETLDRREGLRQVRPRAYSRSRCGVQAMTSGSRCPLGSVIRAALPRAACPVGSTQRRG